MKNAEPKLFRTVVEEILDRFHAWGVKTIFAVPGVQVDSLLLQAVKDGRFRVVFACHELGAGYMGDGFARISAGPGIVITINGPGANNLTTAAVTARVEGSPVLFLTGDSPSVFKGFGCFQCSDPEGSNSTAILREAIKNSVFITNPEMLSTALQRFEDLFQSSTHAPMHINLPSDIARVPYTKETRQVEKASSVIEQDLNESPSWLEKIPPLLGEKAVLLVGREIKTAAQMEAVTEFSQRFAVPVAFTLGSKNLQALLPKELCLGVFGYAGGPRAFEALLDPNLETLIVLGAVLDERSTCVWHSDFFHPKRQIIRFSSDPNSVRKCPAEVLEVNSILSTALNWLQCHWENEADNSMAFQVRSAWCQKLQKFPRIPGTDRSLQAKKKSAISMTDVISVINKMLNDDLTLFLDSGDHRIFAGFFWEPGENGSFFTADQTAPMGWAICAAIGASFAEENKQIWVLTGDGCMLMHGMEIAVAARHKRRVVFLVSNNGSYGRVVARLASEPEEIRQTLSKLPEVSWADFSLSLGVDSRKATTLEELTAAIQVAKSCTGPFLIEILTQFGEDCAYPSAVFSSSSPGFAEKWKDGKPGS